MTDPDTAANTAMAAFWFGGLSASSLIIGALIGIFYKPPARLVAALMAFGGGALLSALAFELVQEAVEKASFGALAIGALIGGLAFVGLNRAVNMQGGFLRKPSTISRFLRDRKRKQAESILERLSRVDILRALPPQDVQAVLPHVEPVEFTAGTTIFEQGDKGDALYLIDEGEVDILVEGRNRAPLARLGPGDAFGEMALLTGAPRSATAVACLPVTAFRVGHEPFKRLIESSPQLSLAVSQLLAHRLGTSAVRHAVLEEEARQWQELALANIESSTLAPQPVEVRAVAKTHGGGGAPVAIWLGILLDGIPESIVIGASMLGGAAVSLSLIAGLFLSNLPEAMSSAVGMRRQGYGVPRVLIMWGSLVVATAFGALAGNVFLREASGFLIAMFEGAAAGAMLAMIAETMMPEAYEQGGSVVGMATLLGFLAAFYFVHISRHG